MPVIERAVPIPRSYAPETSSPSRSSSRSPRRVPSPLRNAQFRPLAMEYALDPQPTSCKYFNNGDEEEEPTRSEYCALVRTVGYSKVGDKSFMSGKCPHCHRQVKSEKQVCTPNATPPPSPWRETLNNLQSPLRSPLRSRSRSPKNGDGGGGGGGIRLQSPLRSPFKGSFFGGGSNDDDVVDKTKAAAGAVGPAPARGVTRSDPRGGAPGSPGPWARSRSPGPRASSPTPRASSPTPRANSPAWPRATSPAPRANSPGPRSPVRGGSSSPSRGAFFGSSPAAGFSDASTSTDTNTKPWASPSQGNAAATAARSDLSARSPRAAERGRSPTPRRPERSSYLGGGVVCGSPARGPAAPRSRSPASGRSPGGGVRTTRHSPGGSGPTRGPRSPGPRSPVRSHSPWQGASFFGNSHNSNGGHDEEEEVMEESVYSGISGSSRCPAPSRSAKSRGAHSPGPNGSRSPLRVKVDFFDEQHKAEEEEEAERLAAAAEAALQGKPAKGGGGWKSPLRSPFKGLFFGGGSSPRKGAAGCGVGTE
eukprot:g13295.t1